MIHIDLPDNVKYVLEALRRHGFEAYAVGGCVRDSLLGKLPKDWDVTTSALPGQVKEIFSRTVDTGIKHGTVTVMAFGMGIEVTTYRVDGEYSDCRHPEEVSFTMSLDEDLKRRDFTINAFVYNEENGIKDLFGGLDDLQNHLIRCVGEPLERFGEDALRILRAIRFSAQLDFNIEEKTFEAAVQLRENLKKVSSERIKSELDKILMSDHPDRIGLLCRMGLANVILSKAEGTHKYSFGKKDELTGMAEASLLRSVKDPAIRWAVVFFYLEKSEDKGKDQFGDISSKVMDSLKFDNRTRDAVLLFLKYAFDKLPNIAQKAFRASCRRLIQRVGKEKVSDFLSFRRAICEGKECTDFDSIDLEIRDIEEKNECTSLKGLAVNGNDLKDNGTASGKEVGLILKRLLDLVVEDPLLNKKDILLELAKNGA